MISLLIVLFACNLLIILVLPLSISFVSWSVFTIISISSSLEIFSCCQRIFKFSIFLTFYGNKKRSIHHTQLSDSLTASPRLYVRVREKKVMHMFPCWSAILFELRKLTWLAENYFFGYIHTIIYMPKILFIILYHILFYIFF